MAEQESYPWLRKIPLAGEKIADRLDGVPVVPVLRFNGVIGHSPIHRGGLSLQDLAQPIEEAFKFPRAKAVALSINSPGGSPVQSSLIAKRVRALAEEHELPVYAFCEDVAASGGYWLACAADEIYADPASIVGSIGVVSAGFGFPALLDKIGVERRVYTAGKKKAILDPFRPEDEDDVAHLKELQKDLHTVFMDYVRSRRADHLADDEELIFSGSFWTGAQSKELGLIDGLGDLRTVTREKFGEKVKLRVVTQPKSWIQRKLGMDQRLSKDWAGDLVAAVEDRAHWSRFGL